MKEYPGIDHICNTALAAARAASRIQLKHFGRRLHVVSAPKFDLTLEIDKRCHEAISMVIGKAFPDHAIVSEESAPINPEAEYIWFIDPLDGTVNFFQGLWHFSICIACYRLGRNTLTRSVSDRNGLSALGEPLVGVVYAPVLDEIYIGVSGQPSTCNGRRITPAKKLTEALSQAVISISFGKDEAAIQQMEKLNGALVRRVRKVRMFGSTGLDIANVAMGRISALIQCSVRKWDFAAARIVLEQSGGRFHARETASNRWEVLACSEALYDPLKEMTAAAWESF